MKSRFILFNRAGVYYSEDTVTRKQHSLRTMDEAEALTLLHPACRFRFTCATTTAALDW